MNSVLMHVLIYPNGYKECLPWIGQGTPLNLIPKQEERAPDLAPDGLLDEKGFISLRGDFFLRSASRALREASKRKTRKFEGASGQRI